MVASSLFDRIVAAIQRIRERPSAYQNRRTCVDIDRILGPIPPPEPGADRPPTS